MKTPIVVVLSGPEKTRAKAELALEKANLTIIPPTEWPVSRKSYAAKDWPHLTARPSGQPPDEEHGFLAVLVETEQAFHAAYGVVAKAKWVLRLHYELPAKPKADPIDALTATIQKMQAEIAELKAGRS